MPLQSHDQGSKAGGPWQPAMFCKGLKNRRRLKAVKMQLKPGAPGER